MGSVNQFEEISIFNFAEEGEEDSYQNSGAEQYSWTETIFVEHIKYVKLLHVRWNDLQLTSGQNV